MIWGLTPRELDLICWQREREHTRDLKEERVNTAILANTIARVMGGTKDSINATYNKMKIPDAEEEANIRVYQGSLVEQLDAHSKYWAEKHEEEGGDGNNC